MVTTDVPLPERPADGHLIIQMESCEINPGDKFFLGRATPPSLGRSVHNIWGVSGIGKVGKIGAGVPDRYRDQKVIVYRSLNTAANLIGTWSEYSQLPYLSCAIVPKSVTVDPSSLVNLITPYAFLKSALSEGHRGARLPPQDTPRVVARSWDSGFSTSFQ